MMSLCNKIDTHFMPVDNDYERVKSRLDQRKDQRETAVDCSPYQLMMRSA